MLKFTKNESGHAVIQIKIYLQSPCSFHPSVSPDELTGSSLRATLGQNCANRLSKPLPTPSHQLCNPPLFWPLSYLMVMLWGWCAISRCGHLGSNLSSSLFMTSFKTSNPMLLWSWFSNTDEPNQVVAGESSRSWNHICT